MGNISYKKYKKCIFFTATLLIRTSIHEWLNGEEVSLKKLCRSQPSQLKRLGFPVFDAICRFSIWPHLQRPFGLLLLMPLLDMIHCVQGIL